MHLRPTDPGQRAHELVRREPDSAVALATVLERSRGLLIQGSAADALAVLDDAWAVARRSESGWYLRAAALTLLGRPGEAARVLQQALAPRGGSVALLFLQSIVRSTLGDSAGSRESLLGAEARRPAAPALTAWRGVLSANAGDSAPTNADERVIVPTYSTNRAPAIESQTPLDNASRPLDALLTPIRAGLGLLVQASPGTEAQRLASPRCAPGPTSTSLTTNAPEEPTALEPLQAAIGAPMLLPRPGSRERDGGRAEGDRTSPSLAVSFRSGQRMRALALVCMALAFAAMVYGQGVAAIALAGGASWLALRSSSVSAAARAREYETPVKSPR